MALDPGTDVGGRMLVTVLVGLAERMVQLKRRGQRRECEQGKPQHRNQEVCGEPFRHIGTEDCITLCYSFKSC